eukprot:TRINITY_DN6897_c0_g1_i2.p1 TRINITY_DN6897_c0_g1~~TRINITY_DN6897_c0_g1_i2.p1  ORF type:complete len:100 (+),score=8.40 TRINITY_DN6897_c0_g1_i2:158-457(+)
MLYLGFECCWADFHWRRGKCMHKDFDVCTLSAWGTFVLVSLSVGGVVSTTISSCDCGAGTTSSHWFPSSFERLEQTWGMQEWLTRILVSSHPTDLVYLA